MRDRRTFAFLISAILLWQSSGAVAADLSSCAIDYGNLMVRHWLTVSSLHQVERLLYYRGQLNSSSPSAVRFNEQKRVIDQSERDLDAAYREYAALFKSQSKEGIEKLSATLKSLSEAVSRDDKQVDELLTEFGRATAGDAFKSAPISTDSLKAAWATTDIDENFRPKRILFGCTGHVGDNRILPLDFDFASGIYTFIVPMKAPDKLDIPAPPAGKSDDVHQWMLDHHMGHHYWAGVYNNQNTYVADWFMREHSKDDDTWMKLANGKLLRANVGSSWGQPNIWNANVRRYIQNYCETQSRYFHDDASLVCYDYAGEPHPYGFSTEPGQPQYSGYNDSAISAFREFLKRKFTTIEKLDRSWKSSYASFESIKPPPDPFVKRPEKASPLSYEFELFRCQSHTDYWKLIYDAYRKHDAKKPIEAHASMYMSGWPAQGMDAYQMMKVGVADWIDMHQNNFPPNLPEQIYLYSVCRLTGKVPVEFEYIWTFPRTGPFDEKNESDFRTTCQASVWRNLVWGKRALVFFDFYYEWPGYRNGLFDKDSGYSILRPSACVVPAIKRQALRFNDILLNTEVENPPIVILQPSASIWNSPPVNAYEGFSFHTSATMRVHDLLFPRNYPFLYVPEDAVLNDGYKLSQHRAIILPQAPYLPALLTDALLKWVRDGGTLIATGVPGIWTPYGEVDMRIVNQAFGKSEVIDTSHGKWQWSWQLHEPRSDAQVLAKDAANNVTLAIAHYDKGSILISSSNFESPDDKKQFYTVLDRAIGQRPARCSHDVFELMTRAGKSGRYLCVLNPDTRETRDDVIRIAGNYRHCEDLGVGSGVPVHTTQYPGETRLKLRLAPGESTVVMMKP